MKNSTRLGYRAKKRRQRRIILVVCTVMAFFAVCAGLLFLLQGSEGFDFKWPGASNESQAPGESGESQGVSGESSSAVPSQSAGQTEASTEETPAESEPDEPDDRVLTIEEVWANDTRTPVEVRGVYLSAAAAARRETLDATINLLDTTEINAVVIDVKDDAGYLTVDLNIELATKVGATEQATFTLDEFKSVMAELKEHGAYLIARIAAFRDDVLAQAEPDCSLWWKQEWGGNIYVDSQGYYWLDPGNETVRRYLLDVSNACVELGFDEIQYDYVRFPTSYIGRVEYYGGTGYYADEAQTIYNTEAAQLRKDTITSFVEYACRELVPRGVYVSADVYGTIIGSEEDGGNVGQDYADLAKWLDYICPMVYPSHYTSPVFGVQYPDTEPYIVVNGAMNASGQELKELIDAGEHCAIVRAWMQTFTADWLTHYITYGGNELRQQINGVYDAGYSEWLLWNSTGKYDNYTSGILLK